MMTHHHKLNSVTIAQNVDPFFGRGSQILPGDRPDRIAIVIEIFCFEIVKDFAASRTREIFGAIIVLFLFMLSVKNLF